MRRLAFITFVVLLLLVSAISLASGTFIEDFSTSTSMDPTMTDAWWDTGSGELKLNAFDVDLVGSYAATACVGISVDGDYALVAQHGSGVMALDVSDPSDPILLDSIATGGIARAVLLSGDLAFVADDHGGLDVLDFSNPSSLVLLGSLDTTGNAYDLTVAGDLVFVADDVMGLKVIDVSTPSSPVLIGSVATQDRARGVAVAGDFAYVADYSMGMAVIDISDPTTPFLAASIPTAGSGRGIALSGDRAYLADYTNGLTVIDISNPLIPSFLAQIDTPDLAVGVRVDGDLAYVSDYSNGLMVVDIADISNPVTLAGYSTLTATYAACVEGDLVYVADWYAGLQVLEVADPTGLFALGNASTPGNAAAVCLAGNIAYVADQFGGMQVIDITDPGHPTVTGSLSTPGSVSDVALAGDVAFLADNSGGVQIVDVSDPTSPTIIGNMPISYALDVEVAGDHIFVAYVSGLQVYDIANPLTPTLIGSLSSTSSYNDLSLAGDLAFVADYNNGLQVVDVSDPTSPAIIGNVGVGADVTEVAVSGDYAYLIEYLSGTLFVIDISIPSAPVVVASLTTPGTAYGLDVVGNRVYVASSWEGLYVVDVTEPTNPVLSDSIDTYNALGVVVAGNHAFLANGPGGLSIIAVWQQNFETDANRAQSLTLGDPDGRIVQLRMITNQTERIDWSLTANGGVHWTPVMADGSWEYVFLPTGGDLRWRSELYVDQVGVNPSCTRMELNWWLDRPDITSIEDVPGDQGHQVRIRWNRSGYDDFGSPSSITEYAIYRQIDAALKNDGNQGTGTAEVQSGGKRLWPGGDWDFVRSVPAVTEDENAVVVPTLKDSTSTGIQYSYFFVRALTSTPGLSFDSPVYYGYSVDNLAPGVPAGFEVAYGPINQLAWLPSEDEDFQYYRIYRSTDPDFQPGPATLVHSTADTDWIDDPGESGGWGYHYAITATDFSGNESEAAAVDMATAIPATARARFALHSCVPNPFNPSTKLSFEMAAPGHARLKVFDATGRLVTTLVDERRDAGSHHVIWNGRDSAGRVCSAGVYLYRLKAGEYTETKRMTLMK